MHKSFGTILSILVTLVIIGILYSILIKMNFGTSLQSKDAPVEFRNNSPKAIFEKSKEAVSAINESAKEHDKAINDALGR